MQELGLYSHRRRQTSALKAEIGSYAKARIRGSSRFWRAFSRGSRILWDNAGSLSSSARASSLVRFQFSWALQISSPSRQYLDAAWPVSIASNCRLSRNELTPSDRQVDLDLPNARRNPTLRCAKSVGSSYDFPFQPCVRYCTAATRRRCNSRSTCSKRGLLPYCWARSIRETNFSFLTEESQGEGSKCGTDGDSHVC